MVLKSPKGIYMQLESGKIIAIRTALKVGHNKDKTAQEPTFMAREMQKRNPTILPSVKTSATSAVSTSNANATGTGTFVTTPKASTVTTPSRQRGANHVQFGRNNSVSTNKNVQMGTAKPYNLKPNAQNMPTTSDASALMQGQYPMSNSSSSFDADISDDSQFLEKLGENLANQQINEDDSKRMNKTNENKCLETSIQNISGEQQSVMKTQINNQQVMQSHKADSKVDNGVVDMLPTAITDNKSGSMLQSQPQSNPEQISLPYHNVQNVENYNSGNNSNYMSNQHYNYNYNSHNNGNYNDAQNLHPGQASQQLIHPTNMMSSQQTDKFQTSIQHVNNFNLENLFQILLITFVYFK